MSFRENLQYLRAQKNLTQEQLAVLLGVSRQSVTKWEAERSYPEMDKLLKLCQLFGCTLDDLVQGNVAAAQAQSGTRSAQANNREQAEDAACPEDVTGYDAHWRTFARKIAMGVALCVLSVVAPALAASEGDAQPSLGVPAANLSVFVMFALIAMGVALIVPAAIAHRQFRKEHPFVIDFYTLDERRRAARTLGQGVATGVACVLAGVGFCVLAAPAVPGNVTGAVVLTCIAGGAALIVHSAIMKARTNVESYNNKSAGVLSEGEIDALICADEPERERIRKAGAHTRKTGAICSAIMLAATVVGLVWMFAVAGHGQAWGYNVASMFWLSWVVGGLACGIVSVIRGAK